jgi:hypothetical protein
MVYVQEQQNNGLEISRRRSKRCYSFEKTVLNTSNGSRDKFENITSHGPRYEPLAIKSSVPSSFA